MRQTDNQQATFGFESGWIAGLIEGEGTIGCYATVNRKNTRTYYKPTIKINNMNVAIIQRTHDFLGILDIPHYVYNCRITFKGKECDPLYAIVIGGVKRCAWALPKLIPSLCSKKRQAELLLELCQSRLEKPMTYRNNNREWDQYEIGVINEIKSLNQRSPQRLMSKTGYKKPDDRVYSS